ncbi:MAG: hypothetical protein IJS78_06240, partial [Clostridia bacterium]|nr:hypothetical protein [Clostridia bacterium]
MKKRLDREPFSLLHYRGYKEKKPAGFFDFIFSLHSFFLWRKKACTEKKSRHEAGGLSGRRLRSVL